MGIFNSEPASVNTEKKLEVMAKDNSTWSVLAAGQLLIIKMLRDRFPSLRDVS